LKGSLSMHWVVSDLLALGCCRRKDLLRFHRHARHTDSDMGSLIRIAWIEHVRSVESQGWVPIRLAPRSFPAEGLTSLPRGYPMLSRNHRRLRPRLRIWWRRSEYSTIEIVGRVDRSTIHCPRDPSILNRRPIALAHVSEDKSVVSEILPAM